MSLIVTQQKLTNILHSLEQVLRPFLYEPLTFSVAYQARNSIILALNHQYVADNLLSYTATGILEGTLGRKYFALYIELDNKKIRKYWVILSRESIDIEYDGQITSVKPIRDIGLLNDQLQLPFPEGPWNE